MLKKSPLLTFVVLLAGVWLNSCQEPENLGPVEEGIPEEIKTQFTELGFDTSDLEYIVQDNPITGEEAIEYYVVEGDIKITPVQLQEMLKSGVHHTGAVEEQYRTTNLVTGLPRTIRVIGYTGGVYALDSKMRRGLSWAINNYNRLNTNLEFTLNFGTNWQAYDIVVYRVSGSAGGSAGFPSGGDPYQFVQIFSGTSAFSTNVVEHVMTHEIGHCVGLRHTDWFNRSLSCGTGGSEGQAGVGAIYIPGTPEGYDPNSVMLACFSSNEDGEFGNFDEVALEYLY